jgi:hypothetical protein
VVEVMEAGGDRALPHPVQHPTERRVVEHHHREIDVAAGGVRPQQMDEQGSQQDGRQHQAGQHELEAQLLRLRGNRIRHVAPPIFRFPRDSGRCYSKPDAATPAAHSEFTDL